MFLPIVCTMPGPVDQADQLIIMTNTSQSCGALVQMMPLPTNEALNALGIVCEQSDSTGSTIFYGNGPTVDNACKLAGLTNLKTGPLS